MGASPGEDVRLHDGRMLPRSLQSQLCFACARAVTRSPARPQHNTRRTRTKHSQAVWPAQMRHETRQRERGRPTLWRTTRERSRRRELGDRSSGGSAQTGSAADLTGRRRPVSPNRTGSRSHDLLRLPLSSLPLALCLSHLPAEHTAPYPCAARDIRDFRLPANRPSAAVQVQVAQSLARSRPQETFALTRPAAATGLSLAQPQQEAGLADGVQGQGQGNEGRTSLG